MGTDVLIRQFTDERAKKVQLIENYATTAADEGRDLTDTERETIGKARERLVTLDQQIDAISFDLEMADGVAERLRQVAPSSATPAHYRTAGEVLYDLLHQSDEGSRSRFRQAMRAAEHMGTDAAKTVPVAGDLGGLVVAQVVGAVIDPYPGGMPFASALGLTEAPNAMHFMRPMIEDPNFATAVGPQGSGATAGFEKAELPSKKFDVTATPIALSTVGTYLNISQQLQSFVPSALDLILRHQLKRLANAIDVALIDEMEQSTGKVTLAADADSAAILKAIYDASAAVYMATGELAEWIVMGPLGWARLGSLVDLAGRPLLPSLGPANAIGQTNAANATPSVAGLRSVVTPGITDSTFWVGNSAVMEGYLYRFPVLEAVEPSVLGRQVAVAAAVAGFRPIANGAIHLAP